jgi:Ni/Co efflux regulator RcnB
MPKFDGTKSAHARCTVGLEHGRFLRAGCHPKERLMKTSLVLAAALALAGSTAVFAAPISGGPTHGLTQLARNDDRNDRGRYDNDRRDNDRRDFSRDRPHWSKGDHLPRDYRDRRYEVTDWRARHLRQPPRGYHWVRADDRYVLAAITSGLIAQVILNAGR